MKHILRRAVSALLFCATLPLWAAPANNDAFPQQFFAQEALRIQNSCLADIKTLDDWTSQRELYRARLREMLGLVPWPEKGDLHATITGVLDGHDFKVEKLHFQASPHLYVTADLYLPKNLDKRAPAILYVCGHARVVTNGLSCGNKAGYQHHGAWFARNGYVCLLIDTVQLGEIEGLHHGTYRENQWWWNSRGYTPAGVEAWFGIRALDYLCSRPEVDPERIGMTGRSGGGSYTWTVAALDDRVKVAAPVAGVTDIYNQVADGAVEGHCDCMFYLNTYRWDFPQACALLAPRPLLIANSDKDSIFPLDGVERLHQQVKRIYQLYGKTNNLGLLITDGPHADTQDLQVPVFRWFNRFLKNEQPLIEMAAKPFFTPLQLRVFGDQLPPDQINTRIQETFGPASIPGNAEKTSAADNAMAPSSVLAALRQRVFAAWPDDAGMPVADELAHSSEGGLEAKAYNLTTQPGNGLFLLVLKPTSLRKPESIVLSVLDTASWSNAPAASWLWSSPPSPSASVAAQNICQTMRAQKAAFAYFAPRHVEPAPWMKDPRKFAQVRRRYMLLGSTVDSMRVWDIRCAVRALNRIAFEKKWGGGIVLQAKGQMAVNAGYAGLFSPEVTRLELSNLPASHYPDGPDYLNVLQIWDIPQMLLANKRLLK